MPKGKGATGMLGVALEADIEDARQESVREDAPSAPSQDRGEVQDIVERINITMPAGLLRALDDLVHEQKRLGNRGVSRSSMIADAVKAHHNLKE